MHIKRAWNLLVFIGTFEVLDYLHHPITTYKAHAIGGSAVACPGGDLKVSKFQKYQISHFAFSYSMMCILIYALCFIGIFFN